MKLIAALSSIAAFALADETPCCDAQKSVCDAQGIKQCPPADFRSTCGDFCSTPVGNPRDCSNRGSKYEDLFMPSGAADQHGNLHGDTMGVIRDDTYMGPYTLRNNVPYFGSEYNNIYFSSNGAISFNQGITSYTSQRFPINGVTMFSPFWSDFNTAIEGKWSFRELRPGQDVQAASAIVNHELDDYSDFAGTDGVIVTYFNVAHYGRHSSSDRRNDMQAILIHDNNHSFAIFQYGDIEWTTGTASNGDSCDGLGGTPAQVGFNDGYGNYFSMPGSQTNEMQNVDDMTNCKTRGRLIFKIDGETVVAATPAPVPVTTDVSIIDPISGIHTFLEDNGLDLSAHGCQCGRFGAGGASGQGRPIDALDKICKNWISKRNCIQKNGGECNPTSSESYVPEDPSNCAAANNACETLACNIDQVFLTEVQAFMAANPGWTPNSAATCDRFGGTPPTEAPGYVAPPKKDSCCGSSASTLIAYASELYECVDDELHSRIPSAADCTAEESWDEASQSCSATLHEMLNSDNSWTQTSLNFYIHVSDNIMTYSAAQTYCQGLGQGAEMAMPTNAQQNQVFFDALMAVSPREFGWWGFRRFNAADTQTWNGSDMRPMNWSNWCANEPNNWNNEEQCSITWSTVNPCWNDINCNNEYRAICIYYA